MIIVLAIFALGSALCGSAQNMNWLIAARSTCTSVSLPPHFRLTLSFVAVQGAGGGGILSVTGVIVADLVPLRERAPFIALLGLYVNFSSVVTALWIMNTAS